ncbi:hypothetical protein JCM10213_007897 [Rhodosporidiobolus nylandii]
MRRLRKQGRLPLLWLPPSVGLVWPGHKWLCDKDPSTFPYPPLSPAELDHLKRIRDKPLSPGEREPMPDGGMPTLLAWFNRIKLFKGSWEELVQVVSTPPSPSDEEWKRNWIIAFAQDHLATDDLELNLSPWRMFTQGYLSLLEKIDAVFIEDEVIRSIPYLRQYLILATLTVHRMKDPLPPGLSVDICNLAARRCHTALEACTIRPRGKERMRKDLWEDRLAGEHVDAQSLRMYWSVVVSVPR